MKDDDQYHMVRCLKTVLLSKDEVSGRKFHGCICVCYTSLEDIHIHETLYRMVVVFSCTFCLEITKSVSAETCGYTKREVIFYIRHIIIIILFH